jgi:3-hydroxyacyl-[acyl-carrier-protein] dehydratase
MNPPPADLETALRSLPHGPDFRFVDRLLSLTPGREGTAEYRVRGDEPFLRGHFPGHPLFPGVLLLEAAAQVAGVVAQTDRETGPLEGLKLAAIRAAKILGSATPGDTIRIRARVVGRLGPLIQAEAEVTLNGRSLLTAGLTLSGYSAGLRQSIGASLPASG